VSYWVALLFTLGSAAWVVNGWFLFFPSSDADLDLNGAGWSGEASTAPGLLCRQAGVLGGTVFGCQARAGLVTGALTCRA